MSQNHFIRTLVNDILECIRLAISKLDDFEFVLLCITMYLLFFLMILSCVVLRKIGDCVDRQCHRCDRSVTAANN